MIWWLILYGAAIIFVCFCEYKIGQKEEEPAIKYRYYEDGYNNWRVECWYPQSGWNRCYTILKSEEEAKDFIQSYKMATAKKSAEKKYHYYDGETE